MLFNSPEYLVFFVTVAILTWMVVGFPRLRIWMLLIASYYFYISNNHWLIVLILASTTLDFVSGLVIEGSDDLRWRKIWVQLSIVANLGLLGYFKYFNFFASSVRDAAAAFGVHLSWTDVNILLPVGISFYTFGSMSYTIDVYRRHIRAERSFHRFAFFVAFFPHLIAGPIVRASLFLPQIDLRPRLDVETLDRSLLLVFQGLFKKIVLAGFAAPFADAVFNSPDRADSLTAWIGVYAFAVQIYFDFSGYTDIAIGSARLLGYELPPNFERPYLAVNVTEFWRRWHMSLSTWLRDYLYIPLGGNRTATSFGVYRNLMLTMMLGGLWHGAAWPFVVWGTIHGGLLAVERWLGVARRPPPSVRERVVRGFLMFQLSVLLWIPFRAESLASTGTVLHKLVAFEAPKVVTVGMLVLVLVVIGAWLAQLFDEYWDTAESIARLPLALKGLAYGVIFAAIVVFNSAGAQPFIYFQF